MSSKENLGLISGTSDQYPVSENVLKATQTSMMTPTDTAYGELYSAYASGSLDAAFSLLVETQAALKEDVATDVAVSELIAGDMLEMDTPAEMADDALAQVYAIIDTTSEPIIHKAAVRACAEQLDDISAFPEPVLGHAVDAVVESGWIQLTPGVRRLTLDLGTDSEVEIYRIEPNYTVPRHSHEGSELTLVMAGGFTDETGSYAPGDLSIQGPNDVHQPTADNDGVCYTLAVRDGGLRFTGLLGVVQRLIGR
ncbi:MAG: ChrR family anti-sigma-E factor [Pseudomonadota bacterium]